MDDKNESEPLNAWQEAAAFAHGNTLGKPLTVAAMLILAGDELGAALADAQARNKNALRLIREYGAIPGEDHHRWLIAQVEAALTGTAP